MAETIRLGDIAIDVTRKDVKHVHLSVHPPSGRITLVAPRATRLEVARAYAASRIGWIRAQQAKLRAQARETPRAYIERESHYVWGRRHLLSIVERDGKPGVSLGHRRITLAVRPGSSAATWFGGPGSTWQRPAAARTWQRPAAAPGPEGQAMPAVSHHRVAVRARQISAASGRSVWM